MIQGLRHRTDLNGRMGEVISWNRARGRYTMSIGENDSTLNVRSENLRRRAQGMARRMCRRPSGAPSAWRTSRRRMSSSPTPQRYTRPAVSGSRSWENAWPGGAAAWVQLSGDETQWVLQPLQGRASPDPTSHGQKATRSNKRHQVLAACPCTGNSGERNSAAATTPCSSVSRRRESSRPRCARECRWCSRARGIWCRGSTMPK